MIRKFATVLVLLLLVRAAAHAQEPPAGQQPAAPGPENPEDESTSRRKAHPHDYKNWTFNIGGGANLPSGTTRTFVKGGGGVAGAGVARNYSKYFGFRLDFLWADLPLRTSALPNEVHFEDCVVPIDQRIGPEGEGLNLALDLLTRLRFPYSACNVGVGVAALQLFPFLAERSLYLRQHVTYSQFLAGHYPLSSLLTRSRLV